MREKSPGQEAPWAGRSHLRPMPKAPHGQSKTQWLFHTQGHLPVLPCFLLQWRWQAQPWQASGVWLVGACHNSIELWSERDRGSLDGLRRLALYWPPTQLLLRDRKRERTWSLSKAERWTSTLNFKERLLPHNLQNLVTSKLETWGRKSNLKQQGGRRKLGRKEVNFRVAES